MSPEEKAIRMELLDRTAEEQEFYRENMESILKDLKEKYNSVDENKQELWLISLAIAFNKFAEQVK